MNERGRTALWALQRPLDDPDHVASEWPPTWLHVRLSRVVGSR